MNTTTLCQLASLVDGKIIGSGDVTIVDALPLQDAYAGCLTLADHPKHAKRVGQSPAAAVMVAAELPNCDKPMLVVADVHQAFQQAVRYLRRLPQAVRPSGIHPTAVVHPTARIGKDAYIGPHAVIEARCQIGERCVIHAGVCVMHDCHVGDDSELSPNTTLYPGSRLGKRCLLHSGAVIGAYGFGYRKEQGRHVRTPQLGWAELGDDVEIGASTAIDRGTYGPTIIGDGTKIDNHVQIGHNCHIGRHNLICAHVGIAGSTSTGEHVVLAGQVGIADHLHLSDNVVVGAQAGVMSNQPTGAVLVGSPAAPRRQRLMEWALIAKLPEMRQQLKDLEEKIAALHDGADSSEGKQVRAA